MTADRATLIALAERVEQAQGPDRLLDANVLWTINPEAFYADAGDDDEHLSPSYCYARGGWTMNRADRYYLDSIPVPAYTASLDAAARLVPEGDAFTVGQNVHHGHWVASVNYLDAEGEPTSRGCSNACRTPARALTAAALRAHAAAMGGE